MQSQHHALTGLSAFATSSQLGLGDYRPRTVPALVKALGERTAGPSVLHVACGAAHTIALCDNVSDCAGDLRPHVCVTVQLALKSGFSLLQQGDVYTWGSNEEMQLGLGTTFGRKVNRPEVCFGEAPPASPRLVAPHLSRRVRSACSRAKQQGCAASFCG